MHCLHDIVKFALLSLIFLSLFLLLTPLIKFLQLLTLLLNKSNVGTLELKWKCANPAGTQGTMYEVLRKVGTAASFSFVGGSGVKSFTDDTLPIGVSPVRYQITAVRSTSRGKPAQFIVNFGTGGSTALTVETVSGNEDMKLAA